VDEFLHFSIVVGVDNPCAGEYTAAVRCSHKVRPSGGEDHYGVGSLRTYTRAGKEKLSCIVASEERDRVCPEVITDIDSEILKSLRLLTIEAARAQKLLQLLSIGSGHGLDRQ